MRKILATLGCLIASTLLLTSCLEEETLELSPYASITSFSINDIKTKVPSLTSDGKDTTTTITLTGSQYIFSIDHNNGLIYNSDSLPKGTDITKVSVNIGFEGSYIQYGESSTPYYSTDSIDFTSPVMLVVYAANGEGTRSYYVRLNVHQSVTDSLVWNKLTDTNFAGEKMQSQKALAKDNDIYVFAQTTEGLAMTSTPTTDGQGWTTLTVCHGITGHADIASVNTLNGQFFLLADGMLHSSSDGIQWEAYPQAGSFDHIIATVDNQLWTIRGNKLLAGTPSEGWEERQTIDPEKFPTAPAVVTTPLKSNEEIQRTLLAGTLQNAANSCAMVWCKLSTESVWTYYNDNTYGCPALQDLKILELNGTYYAFGGKSLNKAEEVKAFEQVYSSTDGGITWAKTDDISLPKELVGFQESFSCVRDDHQTIWLMCSGSNTVYKGRITFDNH